MVQGKNKKFFILLAIMTALLLFSVSAVCNMCGAKTDATDIADEEDGIAAETTAKPSSTTDDSEETTSAELKKPTIKLEIYEGPDYEAASGVCYYRIEAKVTGNPKPKVKFSKDDSNKSFGDYKCQINLEDPSDTYTLNATAANSEGTDDDSIELVWGCSEEENNAPIIDSLTAGITEEKYYINSACALSSHATDPDGDSLTYKWEVAGGTLATPNSQNSVWAMPSSAGICTVKLTVSDGNGGQDSKTEEINIEKTVYNFMDGAVGAYWTTNSGIIPFGGNTDDDRGFARFQNDIVLEDGVNYAKVLETHPRWTDAGWISGLFPKLSEYITIPANAFFKAKVGFIDGSDATNGVYFRLYCVDDASLWYRFPNATGILCTNDSSLNDLNFDLSSIAGKRVEVLLQVTANGNSAQDWAVWVDPVITK